MQTTKGNNIIPFPLHRVDFTSAMEDVPAFDEIEEQDLSSFKIGDTVWFIDIYGETAWGWVESVVTGKIPGTVKSVFVRNPCGWARLFRPDDLCIDPPMDDRKTNPF